MKLSTPRVQQCRENLKRLECRRVEFTIRDAHILKIRQLAYQRGMPIGEALERAIDLLEREAVSRQASMETAQASPVAKAVVSAPVSTETAPRRYSWRD